MSKLLATRSAQRVMMAEFVFNYKDWAIDSVDQVKKTFGSSVAVADPSSSVPGLTDAAGLTLDIIPLPVGAVIVGGEVIVETDFNGIGPGADLSVGVAGSTTVFVNALDISAAAPGTRTAFTLTYPLMCNAGANIRLTLADMNSPANSGKARVRVEYTIDGKGDDVLGA